MNVKRTPDGRYQIRWYEAGRGSPRRQKTFERKKDAEVYASEVRRRQVMGTLGDWNAPNHTVKELALRWWELYATVNLASNTLNKYERILRLHINPRLGKYRLHQVTPAVVMEFRTSLEKAGVGRDSVRVSLVVLQAMAKQAVRWGWIDRNPVQGIDKPSGRRERAVVALAPSQVEAIRQAFLAEEKLYAATIVSVAAYTGLRCPEEVLALQVGHIRENTVLVEQRNIDGEIVPGQKVKGFQPRAVDLLKPVQKDLAEFLMWRGRPGPKELLFPDRSGKPWKRSTYQNWRRREWHPAREKAGVESIPPYWLRHSYASLQVRAGMSIPDLAAQLGHSPLMTIGTYSHTIGELKGQSPMSAEDQILEARATVERQAM